MRPLSLVLPFALAGAHAHAGDRVQSPDAPWRTLRTAHYRIHHPARTDFAAFAREVAARIEGIHALLEREIGHALPGPTDVVVQNPMATVNGMVTPFLERPTVTLWTEPLPSDSELSHANPFLELLLLHELVHLHHLTLPDRRPTLLEHLSFNLRTTRLARKAPPWIIEGYATYLEGLLTGQGRPHSAYRAMVLRQQAREGRLPTYRGLNGVDLNTLSGTRYLAGSAFMQWLTERHPGPGAPWTLLWTRLASRRYPDFDAAFKATFGDEPKVLYTRYTAELTHSALELERRLAAAGLREGDVHTQFPDGFLRYLSVSPDGRCLLAQGIARDLGRQGLLVYLLDQESSRERREEDSRKRRTAKDPGLPAEVPEARPERHPAHTLAREAFDLPDRPRWEADGTIRFEIGKRDGEGVAHVSPSTWKPVAAGASSLAIVHAHPVLREGRWEVELAGRRVPLPFEPFGPVAHDTVRGVVYASTPVGGVFNVVRLPYDPATGRLGQAQALTRTAAGALYPAPTPDGKALYYAQVSAAGSLVRRLDLGLPSLPEARVELEPAPLVKDTVLARADEPSRVPAPVAPPPDHAYRVGESHTTGARLGVVWSPSSAAYLLGAGGSDVLGRVNWVAQAALGQGVGPRGAHVGAAWRGWAWAPSLHLFSSLTRPSRQRFEPIQGLDAERRGGELAVTREWWQTGREGRLVAAYARERSMDTDPASLARDRGVGTLALRQRLGWNHDLLRLSARADLLAQTGRTEGGPEGSRSWNLERGQLDLSLGIHTWTFQVQASAGRLGGHPGAGDRFSLGGMSLGLLPRSLEANVVFQPALPAFSATGDRFERWRAGLEGLLWLEHTRLWDQGSPKPAYGRVLGFELMDAVENQLPSVREMLQRYLGRAELQLTLMRPLDGPHKGRTVASLGLLHRF